MKKYFVFLMVVIVSLCITNIGLGYSKQLSLHFNWGKEFYMTHIGEEGFTAPDIFEKDSNGNFIVSDPAKNRIRLLNASGTILKEYVEKTPKTWTPLKLIVNQLNGKIYIYTYDKVTILDAALNLIKRKSHNLSINSITTDKLGNQYIYEKYYQKKYPMVIKVQPNGKESILIDFGAESHTQAEILYLERENLLAFIKEHGKITDVFYYTLNGKKVRYESLPMFIPGTPISYYQDKFIFWHPENFVITIVNKNESKTINLVEIFKKRHIAVDDILYDNCGPKYSVKFQNGNTIVLASTKKEMVLFEEKIF